MPCHKTCSLLLASCSLDFVVVVVHPNQNWLIFSHQGIEDIQGSKPVTADRHSVTKQPVRAMVSIKLSPARHI